MKKLLLFVLVCAPGIVSGQRMKKNSVDQVYKKSETYRAAKKLSAGGALIGVGGGLLAGSIVLTNNVKTDNDKTTAQIVAAAGGVAALVGGALVGSAGEGFWKGRRETALKFTGTSITFNF